MPNLQFWQKISTFMYESTHTGQKYVKEFLQKLL